MCPTALGLPDVLAAVAEQGRDRARLAREAGVGIEQQAVGPDRLGQAPDRSRDDGDLAKLCFDRDAAERLTLQVNGVERLAVAYPSSLVASAMRLNSPRMSGWGIEVMTPTPAFPAPMFD